MSTTNANAATSSTSRPKEYAVGSHIYQGELFSHDAAAHGGVLLIPDYTGINDHARRQARRLVEQGRMVLVVDLYGKGVKPTNDAEAVALSTPLIENREEVRKRVHAAMNALSTELPSHARIAAVGFSLGGLAALELARSGAPVAGTASIWGVLANPMPESAAQIRGPVLVLHGTKDAVAPLPTVDAFIDEMDVAGRPYQVTLFGGVKHAFTNSDVGQHVDSPLAFDPEAARKAADQLTDFLRQVLDSSASD